MRYCTYFTARNERIDITNSAMGTERIYYNGELVSEAWSFWGSDHNFEVIEEGRPVRYTIIVSVRMPLRIAFDIYRDGMPVLLS